MNAQEKYLARILFQNKIYKANGQAYEDLFVQVMAYADTGFKAIKPQGSFGDRKNDGYNKASGTYYQVYAPEDISKSYAVATKKLSEDFSGLTSLWSPVNEFYFVINDKYKGAYPTAAQDIEDLLKLHPSLVNAEIFLAKDLENLLFSLADDQIFATVGCLPTMENLSQLDYSMVNEVVAHIMALPMREPSTGKVIAPDWQLKITFNKLSPSTKTYLDTAFLSVHGLDDFLHNDSNFLSQELRDHLYDLYQQSQQEHEGVEAEFPGDVVFWDVMRKASPKEEQAYESAALVIMAKYFESCDIFEEPERDLC